MTQAGWLNFTRLAPLMIYAFERPDVTPRQTALFGCGCCRCAQDWRLPDVEGDAIDAMERYHDGEITRRTWLKRRRDLGAKDDPSLRPATKWERDFRAAVVELCHATVSWHVADRLLRSVEMVSDVQYSSAFEAKLCSILRDIFGNPFRPAVTFAPEWRTDTVMSLARTMYDSREFSAAPILADALQDAGCDSDELLAHCRDPNQVHVRGCWVVDRVLGKA
jgi:hypothetical protein